MLKFNKYIAFVCLFFLTFTNSVDPDEMQHFILVFTVCKSTCLGVPEYKGLKRVNNICTIISNHELFLYILPVTVYCQLLRSKRILQLEACCYKTLMTFNDSEDAFHYILTDYILCYCGIKKMDMCFLS